MEYTTASLIVILVIAICEGIKYAGLQSRWIPLIATALGLVGAYIFDGISFLSTAAGVVLGLAATGGYRLVKTTVFNK
jgi:hypothetical protein